MVDFSPIFANVAQQYGLSPTLLPNVAQIESSMNPSVVNQYGYKGLFQEGDPFVAAHGGLNPLDPNEATIMAARGFAESRNILAHALGRAPTDGELYLAHQQGAGGATKLLTHPNELASALVGQKAVTANGGRPGESAADFAAHWTNRFGSGVGPTQEKAQAQFGAVGLPSTQQDPQAAAQPTAPSPQPQANPMADLAASLTSGIAAANLPKQAQSAPAQQQAPPQTDPRALAQALLANTTGPLAIT